MILISDQTPELIDVLAALQAFLGNLEARTVIAIDGAPELIKLLLDAKGIDYVEAPGGLASAPLFDLGAGLRKATPMTSQDWIKEPEAVTPPAVEEKKSMKVCRECGRGFTDRKGVFCSKTCYMKDYFRRNPQAKKAPSEVQKNLTHAENIRLGMAPDERIEANIDRIVANAKYQPEGASIEKTQMARGSLMVRKLG